MRSGEWSVVVFVLGLMLALALGVVGCRRKQAEPPLAGSAPGATTPFHSLAACEKELAARSSTAPPRRSLRIGTWNVRWFPLGSTTARDTGTDIAWLACLIVHLDVDALAVQEFVQNHRGRNATIDLLDRLGKYTGTRWRSAFDDCPDDGRQHVGFLWDEGRVSLDNVHTLAELNPLQSACQGQLRPGIGAYVRPREGPDLHLVAVHLDSGVDQRDHDNRFVSAERMARVLPAVLERPRDADLLVVGDFNTMGCTRCVPAQSADEELRQMTAELSAGAARLDRVAPDHPCSEYYRRNAVALDHVFSSAALVQSAQPKVTVHGPCAELACKHLRGFEAYEASISDHCPVVVELAPTTPPAPVSPASAPAPTSVPTEATPSR